MSNALSTRVFVAKMVDGILVYIDAQQAESLKKVLAAGKFGFVEINGETINTKYIVGIYNAATIEKEARLRNGERQCGGCGQWLPRNVQCGQCFGA